MKKWFLTILLAAGALTGNAAEIVAWKVPLNRYIDDGWKSRGAVRCKSAPEVSPFFKEGDELWDLRNAKPDVPNDQKLSLDWLVWDATSERLVAKGSWTDLSAIHENLRVDALTKHFKLTVGIYEVAPNATPPAEDAKPVSELSMRVKSGQHYTVNWSANGSSLAVGTEVSLGDTDSFADVRLDVTAEAPNQPRLEVNTAFTLKAGSPLWVARDFDGKQGLDLQVSGTVESMNGTPLREVVMMQKGNATQSLWPQQRSHEYEPVPVGGDGWIMSCLMSPEQLEDFFKVSTESNQADPFTPRIVQERKKLSLTVSVKPPAIINSSLDHELLDATEWLKKVVLNLGANLDSNGSFAGYDPIGKRLYFYSPIQKAVDTVSLCLSPTCNLRPALVGVTLDGVGQMHLVGKSGQKSSIQRVEGKEAIRRSLEIEPTIGENDDVLDLRFKFEDRTDAKKITEINSSNSLFLGKPLEVLSAKGPNGELHSLRMTGEMLRISPVDGE